MAYTPPIDAGSCTYNGWDFSLFAKTTVTVRPVLDSAKRVVTHNEHAVEVEDLIVPQSGESDVEALIDSARQLLTARGGHLAISGKAYSLDVNNPSGNVRDVMYGPVPEIVELRPVGSRRAWMLKWRCLAHLPECPAARYAGIMEFVYSWGVGIDEKGYTTRTVSGKLVIAATTLAAGGAGRRVPPDDADSYFERVVAAFPPVPGFKRRTDRSMSEDRRTLTFTLIDRELRPGSFLPGVASWRGRQSVTRTMDGMSWYKPSINLTATYTLDRLTGKAAALSHFTNLILSRARAARGRDLFPLEFAADDGLGEDGDDVTFTFRYTHTVGSDPARALAESGLWLPIPGADWPEWAESMRQTALNARGDAQLFFNRSADLLIDLCDADRLGTQATQSLTGRVPGLRGSELRTGLPAPGRSWLHYEGRLEAVADDGVVELRTLPLTDLPQPRSTGGSELVSQPPGGSSALNSPGESARGGGRIAGENLRGGGGTLVNSRGGALQNNPTGGGRLVNSQASNVTRPSGNLTTNHLQRRTHARVHVRLVGRAIRWGYPIAPPKLLGALGSPAVLLQPRYAHKLVAAAGGPLVVAAWSDTYTLPAVRGAGLPFAPIGFGITG